MANAKICDRCGAVYSVKSDGKASRYTVFDREAPDRLDVYLGEYRGYKVGAPKDLCSDCAESLTAWVERNGDTE